MCCICSGAQKGTMSALQNISCLVYGHWPHSARFSSRRVSQCLTPPLGARLSSDEVLLHQKLNMGTVKLRDMLGSLFEN